MFDLYLSIGGNLGDREKMLEDCKTRIEKQIGSIENESSIYQSESWGFTHPRDFFNQALYVRTGLSAKAVLQQISILEKEMGRERSAIKEQAYEGRLIDVDIIIYENEIHETKDLCIPHPHMQNRNFVMMPMAEIAPDLIHPVLKKSMSDLNKDCSDTGRISKINVKLSDNE